MEVANGRLHVKQENAIEDGIQSSTPSQTLAPKHPQTSSSSPRSSNSEELPGEKACESESAFCGWEEVNKLAPAKFVRDIFPGTNPHRPIELCRCTNPGLQTHINNKYIEIFGCKKTAIPVYFVQLCYADYMLGKNVDYPGVRAMMEERNKLDRTRERNRLQEQGLKKQRTEHIDPNGMQEQLSQKQSTKSSEEHIDAKSSEENEHRLRIQALLKENGDLQWRLKDMSRELETANNLQDQSNKLLQKLQELLRQSAMSSKHQLKLVDDSIEELEGEQLGEGFEQSMREKECPVCRGFFTTTGWYVLGCCGQEYHLQCLLLYAFSERECATCNAQMPEKFYKTMGLSKDIPT